MELAQHVKAGCKDEDLIGLIFNTIGVSDAITMGTDGWYITFQTSGPLADHLSRHAILVGPSVDFVAATFIVCV